MTEISLILIIFLVIIGGLILFYLIRKSKTDERQSSAIKDLERRVTDLVLEIKGSVDGTSQAMHQQISSFTRETVQMREQLSQLQEEVKGISSFQEIFKTPKLRGEWGEASLEHILSEYFPKELYIPNFTFSSGETVEFVLKLPNKKLLPIDAKFFSDNFEKMLEVETEEEKMFFQKKFIQDIKLNIDKIASKYILPSENTVDYALMYIPAEAIFHEILFNLRKEDIGDYARRKKIILTSPNTIYLTLRTIQHWFKDTQISRRTQEILKKLSRIQMDAEKLMEDFRKLGNHLKNATSSYEISEKRLGLFTERVEKLTQIEEPKKLK
ncbi:MAG: DNA recombination protein RmuC [Patescibacteria group bacterium]|nr:DNA recombination protein RmuC [Patescibacteria group bacterium]